MRNQLLLFNGPIGFLKQSSNNLKYLRIIAILFTYHFCTYVTSQNTKRNENSYFSISKTNLSVYANYNLSGFELDAFYNKKSKKGYFIDLSLISDFDSSTSTSSLIGILYDYHGDTFVGTGYSNYLSSNHNTLNEIFTVFKYRFITNLFFIGLSDNISPNYLGILDINYFMRNLPFEASMVANVTTELGITGCDISITIMNQRPKGISFGYTLSNERYADNDYVIQIFTDKYGNIQTKEFSRDLVERDFFNTIFVGVIF